MVGCHRVTLAYIKARSAKLEPYWFSCSATSFFRSSYPKYGYENMSTHKVYFVTGERRGLSSTLRVYTVRVMDRDGAIDNASEYGYTTSWDVATREAKRLASVEEEEV